MKIHKVITLDELEKHTYNLERNLFYRFKNVLLVPRKKYEVSDALRNFSYSKLIQVGTLLHEMFNKKDMEIKNQKKIILENIITLPVTFKDMGEIIIKKNTQSLGNRIAYEFIGNIGDLYIENFNPKSPYDSKKTDLLFGKPDEPIKNAKLILHSGNIGSIYFRSKDSQFNAIFLHEKFNFEKLIITDGVRFNTFCKYNNN